MKTVFIALMRTSSPWRRSSLLTIMDLTATTTVFTEKNCAPHGKKGGKILWRKREVFRFVREYSILRKLRFTTLLHLLHLDWQNRNGIWMRCPLHDACCYLVNAWVGQNVRIIWAGISGEIEKWREEGLLFIFSCYKLFRLTETIILISLL